MDLQKIVGKDNYTDNEYRLVEIKQIGNKVCFMIELSADDETKEVYLNNYYEGVYIGKEGEKYNVYAEIQNDIIISELLYETIVNNAVKKPGNLQRIWVRNRMGNTYVDQPVNIEIGDTEFLFGYKKSYVFTTINSHEFYFSKNKIEMGNPFENCRDIRNVKIELSDDSVCLSGEVSERLLNVFQKEMIEDRLCLAWKDIEEKKSYFFHGVNITDGKIGYVLTLEEMNQLGNLEDDNRMFEWIMVDAVGREYQLYLEDSAGTKNVKMPVKDYFAQVSREKDGFVKMRVLTKIYFTYCGISDAGDGILLGFEKKSYPLEFSAIIIQRVNTDIEYELPFSFISEDENRIVYVVKLSPDVLEENFSAGIHQFWIKVTDKICTEKYPLKLLREKSIVENTYIIARHPFAIVGRHYYNCFFYNDTSNNLKCNMVPKVMKMRITDTSVSDSEVNLNVLIKKEPFFETPVSVCIATENDKIIETEFTLVKTPFENLVNIGFPIEFFYNAGRNAIFFPEIYFGNGNACVHIENNFYRPAVVKRETRSFFAIRNISEDIYRRIWGDYTGFSFAVGSSENLQFFRESGIWLEGDKLCIKVVWTNAIYAQKYNDQKVNLVLRNKFTDREYIFEENELLNGYSKEKDNGFIFQISVKDFPVSEYLVYGRMDNGMISYLEMTTGAVTFVSSAVGKKLQFIKVDDSVAISVTELLLFEDETRIPECRIMIAKAHEENKNRKRKIWLIGENYGLSARDNGLSFFEYCMKNRTSIDAEFFYVTKEKNKDMRALERYKEYLLIYDSPKHIYYDEMAEFYIVTHGIRDVMPSLYHNQMSIYRKPVIYLQHGITAMKKMGISNSSYGGSIRRFAVASKQERELVVKNGQFWEDEVIITGFSRYDKVIPENTLQGQYVWVMPTWRDWLVKPEDNFIYSDFYIYYKMILESARLKKLLKETGQKLVFCLHIEFEKYIHFFDRFENEVIHITDMHEKSISKRIEECSMLITDYSSIAFDVVYVGKPVVFFQFDQEVYSRCRGSYINLERDLPGEVTYTHEKLIDVLTEKIKDRFSFAPEYRKRAERYFDFRDCNNSERIYRAIIQCREEIADEY